MISRLIETLSRVGKHAETWVSPDNSVVLVLPYGGRILGLFAPGSSNNFLWTHPALSSVTQASAFYASSEWHNSGGDRTWLAPEVDFFLPEFPSLDRYQQPREFDPGDYQVVREDNSIGLRNRFKSRMFRSGATVDLQITKRISPALNPLRQLDTTRAQNIDYAGFSLRTSLEIKAQEHATAPLGLWSLLQLPHGGDLLIPTYSKSEVIRYMGTVDACDLQVSERLIRYRMHSKGEHKLGFPAEAVTGRAGYLLDGEDGSASLVIRNFSVNPSGKYVDVPWTRPESRGSAIEACNVSSKLGDFSELEYHAPAIGGSSGELFCEDVSQTWAFRGPKESILVVARMLLSPDV